MSGSLDAFVKSVMGLTVSASWRELADLHRKAVYDVLERNIPHLDSVLETLTIDRYSMSVVSILLVKMNQIYTESVKDRFERTLSQVESMVPFFDSMQISFIPDIYVLLFRKVYEYCLLQINKPARGIMLLSNAINVLVKEERDILTSLHPCLFCLCLKARIHDPAMPFLHLAVPKIFKETANQTGPYMDPKWVVLYFYYGGLLYAVLGRYEEAFAMMQKACCIPAIAPSAIMVRAYKTYVLLSLLLHGKILRLSNYRSPVMTRSIIPLCPDYSALERICDNEEENFDKASAILEYLEAHYATFEKDKTVGLVKLVVRSIRENSVKRLTECFISISLSDVARRCHLDDSDHAELYLREMSKNGKINVRIDKKQGIVYFDEMKTEADEQEVDKAANSIYTLDALMKQFDDRIRVNPSYISRVGRPLARGVPAIPPDEGLGHPGSVFMPNVNVGDIESAAGRPMDMVD
uniref:COP9 signalosome complex subunit 3 n=1 Tax=Wuchereria bancrofti TaxID=6293 RepID=A0AAF5PWM7_WUCBA